jgi:hypothetical protein
MAASTLAWLQWSGNMVETALTLVRPFWVMVKLKSR